MPAKDIAVAAVYFAAKFTRERIADDDKGNPWWVKLGGTPQRIVKAVEVMNEFWVENPLKRSENPYEQSPSNGVSDLEKTRNRREPVDGNETPTQDQQEHLERQAVAQSVEDLYKRERAKPKPAANGHDQALPSTEVDEDHRLDSIKEEAAHEGVEIIDPETAPGDADAHLKAVANDPATHQHGHERNGTTVRNGIDATLAHRRGSSKRKDISDDDDASPPVSQAKRIKTEEDGEEEEGEEGELSE